jgi:hypothetical protein
MKNLKTILFFLVASSMAFMFVNCIDEGSIGTPSDDDTTTTDEYVREDPIEEEHVVGDSSCPQKLAELSVHASGEKETLDKVDSCFVSCASGSIDVYFDGDKNSQGCTFADASSSCDLSVEFNCNQAADVKSTVECTFYKDNQEVNSASIPVKVEVK